MSNQKSVYKLLGVAAAALMVVFVFSGCQQSTGGTKYIPPATESFTVYFDSGEGGNAINPQTVTKGSFLATVEPVNSDSDYYFVGWFPDTADSDRWDFELDPVTENMTLVARWVNTQSVLLSIDFDSNGGSAIDSLENIKATDSIDLSSYKPVRDGYDFSGWFNYSYGGDQGIIQSIDDIWARITETTTVTLTAMWSRVILQGTGGNPQPFNPNDIVSYFIYQTNNLGIDPALNATQNLQKSILGNQVDGPGTGSSYTGLAWQDNGNIRVLDNTDKAITPFIDGNGIFEFYLHDQRDFDGSSTGRQRIEIKGSTAYSSTDDKNIKAKEDDIITYYWRFKLPEDLVNVKPAGFFHIFQVKCTVGAEAGAPLVSFTVTKDNLLFRNTTIGANMDTTEVIAAIPMSKVLDRWLAAEVTIHFRDNGYIYGQLTDLQNNTVLMREFKACDTWRRPEVKEGGVWIETKYDAPSNQLCRPKWGLYRALNSATREASMMWGNMLIVKRDK
ncbi:MAG: InlB B-repeat-containing protein, partial [Treponema sp.]|nr:InlB B-repeat-containing protein [Treponema sp.]